MISRAYESLSPKQRVLKMMNHEQPDRVPINYLANPGIDAKLKAHFGLKSNDDEGLLNCLGVDFRGVGPAYVGGDLHGQLPGRRIDHQLGYHLRYVENDSGGYWDYCDFPLEFADEEQVAAWPMPTADDFDYSTLNQQCRAKKDFALVYGSPGIACAINTAGFLRGMEQTLVDLITEDPAGLLLMDRFLGLQLSVMERALEICKNEIDLIWIGEDLGTQHTQLISMDILKKQILPRHKPFLDLAKSLGIPVMMHTCGSSSWAYDEYIKLGLSGVDTLQPEAANMSPEYLKARFGNELFFHGGISTAGSLSFGSKEQTVEEVRRTLNAMMPGGGYTLAPTHSIQDNSPLENVLAMYECAHTLGRYK